MATAEPTHYVRSQGVALCVRKWGSRINADGCLTRSIFHDPLTSESEGYPTYSLRAGWSYADGRLVIHADRLGIIPIYFYANDNEIIVSDSIVELPRRFPKIEIDLFEVYAFLKLGVYLGTATPFRGVQRLRPGEVVVWDRGAMTRWAPTADCTPYAGTRREALDEAQHLFEQAIRRRRHENLRPIVPVSGGRDSRHVLLELARQRVPGLQAVTVRYLYNYPEDVRVGRLIAHTTSVPHIVLSNDHRKYFLQLADQILINSFETTLHGWMRPLTAQFSTKNFLVYDGIGGDALLNSAYAHVLPRDMFSSVQSGNVERMADTFVGGDFEPPRYLKKVGECRDFGSRLKDRLVEEMSRHACAPDIMCRFMYEHRTRRATGVAPISVVGSSAEVSLPYLDEDLMAFAYRLPATEYWNTGFHDEMIAKHYPRFTHLGYERIELRDTSRLDRSLELRLLFAYVPILFRGLMSGVVRRFQALSRFLWCCFKLRMSDYFYVADSVIYFDTLRRRAKATGSSK